MACATTSTVSSKRKRRLRPWKLAPFRPSSAPAIFSCRRSIRGFRRWRLPWQTGSHRPSIASVHSFWASLAMYADAADTFWQEWVVSYDLGRQLALADKMEQSSRKFKIDWFTWNGESASRWQWRARAWMQQHLAKTLIAF